MAWGGREAIGPSALSTHRARACSRGALRGALRGEGDDQDDDREDGRSHDDHQRHEVPVSEVRKPNGCVAVRKWFASVAPEQLFLKNWLCCFKGGGVMCQEGSYCP